MTSWARFVTAPDDPTWLSDGGSRPARLPAIDSIRGAAFVGMVVYHAVWDLHAVGFLDVDPSRNPVWQMFGQGVAAVFLLLSGTGLILADRRGESLRRVALRLCRIGAAASAVTLATFIAARGATIWFGILHCILVTNIIALALRRWRTSTLIGMALICFGLPSVLFFPSPVGWAWTGLTYPLPETLDFRPVLPWLGFVVLGMVAARIPASALRMPIAPVRLTSVLAWLGRHTLVLYLAHQPVLFAACLLAAAILQTPTDARTMLRQPAQAAAFLDRCAAACTLRGRSAEICASTCHCILTSAIGRRDDPAQPSGTGAGSLDAAVAACRVPDGAAADQVQRPE